MAICLLTESAKRKADCRAPYSDIQIRNWLLTGARSDERTAARWSPDQRDQRFAQSLTISVSSISVNPSVLLENEPFKKLAKSDGV